MGKLNLKETPEERAERKRRRWRSGRKSANARRSHSHTKDTQEAEGKAGTDGGQWHDGEDDDEGWAPPEGSIKIDADEVRAEVEERLFREKLFDAMAEDYDDDRLDGVQAQMNSYSHVPNRWKNSDGRDRFDDPTVDPNQMLDEEYAEWIRMGMYRRTHKAEIEEKERKEAERKARKEEQRKAREEAARLEQEREAERKVKRELRLGRRRREAWDYYEARWKRCLAPELLDSPLKFRDIPWPVFTVPTATEHLTKDSITVFLLYGLHGDDAITESKSRRERIREALLRWHPDKFQGKLGPRLDTRERGMVLEGVGIVARCLNELMAT